MKLLPVFSMALLLALTVQSCHQLSQAADSKAHSSANSDYPVGMITSDKLLTEHKNFMDSYQAYTLSDDEIKTIEQWPSTLTFTVFFGTWCHDSVREVPHLIKVLEHQQASSASYVALDFNKSDPLNMSEQANIKYTPTIIVYSSDIEVGRIIERPKTSLVEDINALIRL